MTDKMRKRLTDIKQIPYLYPGLSANTVHWWMSHRKTNGFDACVRKMGLNVLIDLDKFEQWIDSEPPETK